MITSSGHSSSCLLQALNWKFKLLGLVSCFDRNLNLILGLLEVCGVRDKRADNVWLAAEGVYLPVTESK
ncbi:hypothetical protein CK203_090541 [Vitis vinifera]|uniref:Uncharacterized protein n=1 Tax=Vitis vinifera TaxID=29760 RepID=A0A438F2E0_VITVI|nr:hypothetical protein CK203_090541 [Vitis vinifera]